MSPYKGQAKGNGKKKNPKKKGDGKARTLILQAAADATDVNHDLVALNHNWGGGWGGPKPKYNGKEAIKYDDWANAPPAAWSPPEWEANGSIPPPGWYDGPPPPPPSGWGYAGKSGKSGGGSRGGKSGKSGKNGGGKGKGRQGQGSGWWQPPMCECENPPFDTPTFKPTKAPTGKPIVPPTYAPTYEPTYDDETYGPTYEPTYEPTATPPTDRPIDIVILPQTDQPNPAPATDQPTDKPSPAPTTFTPTTDQPNPAPTINPTTSAPTTSHIHESDGCNWWYWGGEEGRGTTVGMDQEVPEWQNGEVLPLSWISSLLHNRREWAGTGQWLHRKLSFLSRSFRNRAEHAIGRSE